MINSQLEAPDLVYETGPMTQGRCRFCNSRLTTRYGMTANGRQRYRCRSCGRTFVSGPAPPGMRFPVAVIASALNLFYEGASLHTIRRQLGLEHGMQPDHSTIHRWVVRYTKQAVRVLAVDSVRVGTEWAAIETPVELRSGRGRQEWIWDIVDFESRFLLASCLTAGRTEEDAGKLLAQAGERAGQSPRRVTADNPLLRIRPRRVGSRLSEPARQPRLPYSASSTRGMRQIRTPFKARTPVLQTLVRRDTTYLALAGWSVHYNFFRPHSGLHGRSPAEAAAAEPSLARWADVVTMGTVPYNPRPVSPHG